jgi:hypothetical protein
MSRTRCVAIPPGQERHTKATVDGTTLGTKRVKDINASGDPDPTELIKAGTHLFFAADDGTHGVELGPTSCGPAGEELDPGAPR